MSLKHQVIFFDKDPIKVDQINQQNSPISDQDIEKFLTENKIQLLATTDFKTAITGADLAIIATPTDYDIETSMFNTESVENSIKNTLVYNKDVLIVVKSRSQLDLLIE